MTQTPCIKPHLASVRFCTSLIGVGTPDSPEKIKTPGNEYSRQESMVNTGHMHFHYAPFYMMHRHIPLKTVHMPWITNDIQMISLMISSVMSLKFAIQMYRKFQNYDGTYLGYPCHTRPSLYLGHRPLRATIISFMYTSMTNFKLQDLSTISLVRAQIWHKNNTMESVYKDHLQQFRYSVGDV